jgi:hypothetical protein
VPSRLVCTLAGNFLELLRTGANWYRNLIATPKGLETLNPKHQYIHMSSLSNKELASSM